MHPSNKLANQRRRTERARRFPDNTCPASRHVQLIADALVRKPHRYCSLRCDPEEAEWIAGDLYAALESLWKARTKLNKESK